MSTRSILLIIVQFFVIEIVAQVDVPNPHNPVTQDATGIVFLIADLASSPKYDVQSGKIYLNDGDSFEGKFRIRTSKISYYADGDEEVDKFKFEVVDSLVFFDESEKIKFLYLNEDKHSDFYKVIYDGKKVQLLNNYYSTGERAEVPNDFRQLIYVDSENYGRHNWKKMKEIFHDVEYMEGMRNAILKLSNFYSILNNVVLLLDQRNPKETHGWKKSKITLKNEDIIEGYAFCQPYFSQANSTDNRSFIHFFDGKSFRLYSNEEVNEVLIGDVVFKAYYSKNSFKYVFAREWNYSNKTYLVYQQMDDPYYYLYNDPSYLSHKDFVVAEKEKNDKLKTSGKLKSFSSVFLNEMIKYE